MGADQHGLDDAAASGGTGGTVEGDYTTRTVTTAGTLQAGDRVVWLDASGGPFTFTLPSASLRPGRPVTIARVNAGPNVPTIAAAVGELVALAATLPLLVLGESYDLVADGGANWRGH